MFVLVGYLAGAHSAFAQEGKKLEPGETILSLRALKDMGVVAIPTGKAGYIDLVDNFLSISADSSSRFQIFDKNGALFGPVGSVDHLGGLDLISSNGRRSVRAFTLVALDQPTTRGLVDFDIVDASDWTPIFHIRSARMSAEGGVFVATSDRVMLSDSTARALGLSAIPQQSVGTFAFRAKLNTTPNRIAATSANSVSVDYCAPPVVPQLNPDIIVCFIHSTSTTWGEQNGISAFSFGTTSANIGTDYVLWCANLPEHPVIAQNVLRLKDNRFEHIGQSWVKHTFAAIDMPGCADCQRTAVTTILGVGCADPYSSTLNGTQYLLGPKSEINAHTGVFPYPHLLLPDTAGVLEGRLQIHNEDIDPALNPGAIYFVEAQYVTADDALAGNGNNNATYRRVFFITGGMFPFTAVMDSSNLGLSRQQQPAIRAWQEADPSVIITEIQVPGEGLFLLGAKAWPLTDGFWAYEYALENLNSDRSCGSFSVPTRVGATIRAVGFHDVDYHSGEPFDGTDWSPVIGNLSISWSTVDYDTNPNANALRWSTLYNFRFESNSPPDTTTVTLGLFRPGFPKMVTARSIGPLLDIFDCNGNGIEDACDISCTALDCGPPCGITTDCDSNGVPDECQTDCNANGQADACDIGTGASTDCNANDVPDECEPDCDGDGIIDACDPPTDCDGDGVEDCLDLCPCSTVGIDACLCPPLGECCFPDLSFCIPDFPPDACFSDGGVPDCLASPCRAGCLPSETDGDFDRDSDRDVYDFSHFLLCFTSDSDKPTFTEPSDECAVRFDFDNDNDIDLLDLDSFLQAYTGPSMMATGP